MTVPDPPPSLLASLDALGWFAQYPDPRAAREGYAAFAETSGLESTPATLVPGMIFDEESIGEEGDHVRLLEELVRRSFGLLEVGEMVERWDEEGIVHVRIEGAGGGATIEGEWALERGGLASGFEECVVALVAAHPGLALAFHDNGTAGEFWVAEATRVAAALEAGAVEAEVFPLPAPDAPPVIGEQGAPSAGTSDSAPIVIAPYATHDYRSEVQPPMTSSPELRWTAMVENGTSGIVAAGSLHLLEEEGWESHCVASVDLESGAVTRTPLPPGRLPLSLHRVFDEVWLHDDELPGAESFGPMAWRRLRDGAWESLDLPGDVIGATEDAAGRWAVCRSGRWNIETGDRAPRGDDPDDALSAAIDRSAIVARGDDRVLVATEDGMELFSLPGGDRVWRIATLLEHPILVGNRIVNGNAVHDLATGAHMHGKFDADRFSRRSVVTGEHLWFLATPPRRKSSLCCVRLGDGKQVAKIALDFDPMGIYSAPGQLLITAFAGVHCFA